MAKKVTKKVTKKRVKKNVERGQDVYKRQALGLRKIGQSKEFPNNKATQGMIQNVRHLIKVEEI